MQEPQQYHANHATFDLPAGLKDKTVHMFTLKDDGPSEFSVVISHADVQPEEKLAQFGERLVAELKRALPRFELKTLNERTIDGAPAIELAYSWRNEGNFMHQRQAITLTQGNKPGAIVAMMIAATCLKTFSDEWNAAFDAILDSTKLRRPLSAAPAPRVTAALPPPTLPTIFALSEPRKTLHVFANKDEAGNSSTARNIETDHWEFYDANGTRLHANAARTSGGLSLLRPAGAVTLERRPEPLGPNLRERLHLAQYIQASSASVPFYSLTEVRAHLDQLTER